VSLQCEKCVDGLFLSSGIVPDGDTTMENMLATVERLRLRESYTGYIHLKLIPVYHSSTSSARSSWPIEFH
jgi:predicted DNA-binding helix-hairpin-helix protein